MKILSAIAIVLTFVVGAFSQPCVDSAKEVKPAMPQATAKTYEANLAVAREAYTRNPDIADEHIWYGRRTAYLGEYKEAIRIFTEGIQKFPKDARLYRHRGHRYITLRCFDDAVRDLERAAKLVHSKHDETEPDGIPNERNTPTSTLQSNIWYHLGLAYYLKGDFKSADKAYREAWKVSKNNDMRVATAYWHYMTLRRMGNTERAAKLLEPFTGEIEVIENDDYLKLIKLNRGEAKANDLLSTITGDTNSLGSASLGYGIGNYYLYNGDGEKAIEIFNKITAGNQWSSFGFIAAETELKRK